VLDDDRLIRGRENIESYLEELAAYLEEWQKFQSDACYCSIHGEVE
jgi:hypothetical protein